MSQTHDLGEPTRRQLIMIRVAAALVALIIVWAWGGLL